MLISMLALLAINAFAEQTIEKCQNEGGNWQYANRVGDNCDSTVSTLNEHGVVMSTRNLNNPNVDPEDQELQQRRRDARILKRYSNIQAIEFERSRKLAEVDRQLSVNQRLISDLDSDMQMLMSQTPTDESKLALSERERAAERYLLKQVQLNTKLDDINREYSDIIEYYNQAKARRIVNSE